eukprot:4937182-Pyramimonas_sp.AAC.1
MPPERGVHDHVDQAVQTLLLIAYSLGARVAQGPNVLLGVVGQPGHSPNELRKGHVVWCCGT